MSFRDLLSWTLRQELDEDAKDDIREAILKHLDPPGIVPTCELVVVNNLAEAVEFIPFAVKGMR